MVAPGADLAGLDGAVNRRIRSSDPEQALQQDCPGVIATSTAMPLLPADRCRVVIWAGAGQEALELPESWLVTPHDQPMSRLVIDFKDTCSPVTANWSRRRKKQYAGREWVAPSQSRYQFRVECAYDRMIRVRQGDQR